MTIHDSHDVDGLRQIGQVVAQVRDAMGARVRAGISTAELDDYGRELLDKHGARPAPKLAYGFPGTTCISVNDALAHGIASEHEVLREGDLVNIDVSAELDGYWADTGASFGVGRISQRDRMLLDATRQALAEALREVATGRPIRNIGRAVSRRARKAGFHVVRELCGHGVGRFIHEEPSIPNVDDVWNRERLCDGAVITIEPFFTTGARTFVEDADGWTLRTPDGSRGAQFEHTMIVTATGPMIVT
jgi:methionyl aminopeptidase